MLKKNSKEVFYHNAVTEIDLLMMEACEVDASTAFYKTLRDARMQADKEVIKEIRKKGDKADE